MPAGVAGAPPQRPAAHEQRTEAGERDAERAVAGVRQRRARGGGRAAGAGVAAGRVICSPCTCTGFVTVSGGTSSVGTSTVVGGGPSITVNGERVEVVGPHAVELGTVDDALHEQVVVAGARDVAVGERSPCPPRRRPGSTGSVPERDVHAAAWTSRTCTSVPS